MSTHQININTIFFPHLSEVALQQNVVLSVVSATPRIACSVPKAMPLGSYLPLIWMSIFDSTLERFSQVAKFLKTLGCENPGSMRLGIFSYILTIKNNQMWVNTPWKINGRNLKSWWFFVDDFPDFFLGWFLGSSRSSSGVFFWCFLVVALNLSKRVTYSVFARRLFFECVCVHLYTMY